MPSHREGSGQTELRLTILLQACLYYNIKLLHFTDNI